MARVALVLFALVLAAAPARGDDYVIHISVDGLSGQRLQALVAADTTGQYANFARLASEGAITWNARADYTHTITLPNHTTMLTGRPVSRPSGQPDTVHHGYTSNGDPSPGTTLHNGGNPNLSYVASVFDVVHDHGLSTALFASKSKFVLFEQSYDAGDGAPDVTGADDGRDKIDRYVNASPASMQSQLLSNLGADHYRYTFVHYANPDDAGHDYGWGSAQWNAAVHTVDGYLGQLFALLEADAVLSGHTFLILSADHGGSGTEHNDAALAANYTVPFLVWGPGVSAGADLYALTPQRADPGTARPDYNAAPQPIRNGDGADLALALLGLPPLAGAIIRGDELQLAAPAPVPLLPVSGSPQ